MTQSITSRRLSLAWTTPVALAALLWIQSPRSLGSGTLIQEHLASIQEVRLEIALGGIQFEPVPGVKVADFEKDARDRAALPLGRCGIDLVDSAPQILLLTLRTSRSALPSGLVALAVRAELREPAQLARRWASDSSSSSKLMVTTWRSWFTEIAGEEESANELLSSIVQAASEFAQAVGEAQATGKVPATCFDATSAAP